MSTSTGRPPLSGITIIFSAAIHCTRPTTRTVWPCAMAGANAAQRTVPRARATAARSAMVQRRTTVRRLALLLSLQSNIAGHHALQDAAHGVPLDGQTPGHARWLQHPHLVARHHTLSVAAGIRQRSRHQQVARVLRPALLERHLDRAATEARVCRR